MQETWVQSLGQEDPLEKEMATCSSILAWRIPWTEEPGRLQSMGSQELDMTEQINTQISFTIVKVKMDIFFIFQHLPIALSEAGCFLSFLAHSSTKEPFSR